MTPAPPAPGTVSVTVDFESNSDSASVVAITCSVLSESATGININLQLPNVPANDSCVIEYPTTLDCAIGIEPASVARASAAGVQNIQVPATGDANVFVGINCVEPQVAGIIQATTTTVVDAAAPGTTVAPTAAVTPTTTAPAAATPTTTVAPAAATPTTVATNVAGAVQTAPAATAQTGTPTFTG